MNSSSKYEYVGDNTYMRVHPEEESKKRKYDEREADQDEVKKEERQDKEEDQTKIKEEDRIEIKDESEDEEEGQIKIKDEDRIEIKDEEGQIKIKKEDQTKIKDEDRIEIKDEEEGQIKDESEDEEEGQIKIKEESEEEYEESEEAEIILQLKQNKRSDNVTAISEVMNDIGVTKYYGEFTGEGFKITPVEGDLLECKKPPGYLAFADVSLTMKEATKAETRDKLAVYLNKNVDKMIGESKRIPDIRKKLTLDAPFYFKTLKDEMDISVFYDEGYECWIAFFYDPAKPFAARGVLGIKK